MIKAEFRIGNLVQIEGYVDVFEILELKIDEVTLGTHPDYHHYDAEYDEIKPIPLTEDWLLRLPENLVSEDMPSWIKYIHELQNWYFIEKKCREELILSEAKQEKV